MRHIVFAVKSIIYVILVTSIPQISVQTTFLNTIAPLHPPKPDAVFYLHVPMKIVEKLLKERNIEHARAYLGKKKDVHETDMNFLKNSEKSALWLADREKNWKKIECAPKGAILPREDIHEEIYKTVRTVLKK